MQLVNPMPKLYTLVKPTKNFTTWYVWVAYLSCKNLLHIRNYVIGMDEVSGLALNEICGLCMMSY